MKALTFDSRYPAIEDLRTKAKRKIHDSLLNTWMEAATKMLIWIEIHESLEKYNSSLSICLTMSNPRCKQNCLVINMMHHLVLHR